MQDPIASTKTTAENYHVAQRDGPVQFISIEENGQCTVCPEAAAMLGQLQGSVAVIGVAGLYRTGKSFLLNRLVGQQDGFEIGPTVNPCTKGLWIWGRPKQLAPNFHCILLDTEGLGSPQRSATCDMQIISLAVLLSSLFIYNSMGAIDEASIEELHLVLQLCARIHVSSQEGDGGKHNESSLSDFLPGFLWVLRDFHLQLVDARGNALTETEYLEDALRSVQGQDDKNKFRSVIRELFRNRDCMTLCRPVDSEKDLRCVQSLPYDSLRLKFRIQMEKLCDKIYSSVQTKDINGTQLTGAMFVAMAQAYCKAINSGAVPVIQSAWSSVVRQQMRTVVKEVAQSYRQKMNETALAYVPMPEDQLVRTHEAAVASAKKEFMQLARKYESGPGSLDKYEGMLKNEIDHAYEHVVVENQIATQVQTEMKECVKEAVQVYRAQINEKALEHLPMDEEELYELHTAASTKANELFARRNFEPGTPGLDDNKLELRNGITLVYDHIASENRIAMERQCTTGCILS